MNATHVIGDPYNDTSKVAAWIRNPGVRETFESVLIAILLALLFRFFEAEAFVIPTGFFVKSCGPVIVNRTGQPRQVMAGALQAHFGIAHATLQWLDNAPQRARYLESAMAIHSELRQNTPVRAAEAIFELDHAQSSSSA